MFFMSSFTLKLYSRITCSGANDLPRAQWQGDHPTLISEALFAIG